MKPVTRARRATAALAVLAAACVAALCASGCGSSSATLDPVASAAEVTSHVGGAHLALSMQVSASGLPSTISASGEGFFNYATHEGMLSLDLSGLPASAALPSGPLRIEEIFKSATIYVGSPLFAGKLPGGARWMKLDLGRVGQALGFDLQQLAGGQANPAQFLEFLKASGGSVSVVGQETVRGVETTRYRGTLDLNKALDVVPSSARAALRSAISKMGISSLPVEVWVDAHKLVRRIALALKVPAEGQELAVRITVELFDFGRTPRVSVPSGNEVFDATGSALGGLGKLGG
ncbi:MAG: hypothetical protein E6G34_14100 [Actinobacteria bacterium]|nr:MAG: hypothetical protein E6G34_14100 [Actinomycetota bacterium]